MKKALEEHMLPSLINRLSKPSGPIDLVLDTDAFNEIDDQFAISYMLKKRDRLHVKAIYAAPFFNEKSSSPEDGMRKSHQEILKLLSLMKLDVFSKHVYHGSTRYLPDEQTPVPSPAAADLAERAAHYTPDEPLYVVAIGAITNIASALLLNPAIRDRIVIVWLGGHAHHLPENGEFNLSQDIAAARVVFGCGAAVVQLPCYGVVSSFSISEPELNTYLKGKNALCDYLVENTVTEAHQYVKSPVWSRIIWDVTAVAWLLDQHFMSDCLVSSPIPEYTNRYSFDVTRHPIKYVYQINRDALMQDLVETLTETAD